MAERWFLMPLDTLGSVRAPKYLRWVATDPPPARYNHPGLPVTKWNAYDLGALDWAVVLVDADAATLTTLSGETDVFIIPATLTGGQRNRAVTFLENRGIPGEILPPIGATDTQVARALAMVAQFFQAMHVEALGRPGDGALDDPPPLRVVQAIQRRPRYSAIRTDTVRNMIIDAVAAWGAEPIFRRGGVL
jgi:hypothetical protein